MPEENPSTYYMGVRFQGSEKSYYFSTTFDDLKIGDLVVVDTVNGYEIGTITTAPISISFYRGKLELKPILRKPTRSDMVDYNFNLKESKRAMAVASEEIKALGLPMDLISAYYTLDGSKVTITYTSTEKRVDFRELLRRLVPALNHCRVELRQLASRDRAKMVGGIGACGLPLCCSTFLNQFEGISIAKAKNQMLTLNIPKLSGPCNKLLCCLAYEDETYTIEKKEFPHIGTVVHTEDGDYTVDAMNIISRTVRIVNSTRDDYKTYSLEDIKAMMNGTYKKKEEVKKVNEYSLPDFNISAVGVRDASYGGNSLNENAAAKPERDDQNNRGRNRNKHRGNDRRNNNQGGNDRRNNQSGNDRRNNNQQRNNQNNNQNNRNNQQRNNRGQRPDNNQNRPNNNQNRPNNQNKPNNQNQGQNQGQGNNNNRHRHHRGHRPNNNQNKGE
ncbi:MAG: stage 0 sporulation protein [Bacilli bacterium]|nr:stage 0 sporulation protein [Bacilli bacterium]